MAYSRRMPAGERAWSPTTLPMSDAEVRRAVTFVVRLLLDEAGQVTCVVERVSTGEKERFRGVEALSPLVARMVLGPPSGG